MKKIMIWILTLVIAIQISGCAPLSMVMDEIYGKEAVSAAEAIAYIGFSVEKEPLEIKRREAIEFQEHTGVTVDYSNDYFYQSLTSEEQLIYNAYIYAMENGYMNVYVDEKLFSDSETLARVLEFLSYDSPLLEQNLRYELTTFAANYSVVDIGPYQKMARFEGVCIRVYNFEKELWDKKKEAVEEARQIVERLPKDLSKAEKAKRLYRYVATHIQYKEYKNLKEMEVKPYLYDALVKRKSHCDGYTNALALLFEIAGIESLEKTYIAGPDKVGHTWNMYAADGVWYNADAVPPKREGKKEKEYRLNYHFAFPDSLQTYVPYQETLYPPCEKKGEIPFLHLKHAETVKFRQSVRKGLETKKRQILILLDSYDEDVVDRQMQTIANDMQGNVNWFIYSVVEGRTVLHVYR